MKAKCFLALLISVLMILSLAGCAKDTYKTANDLMKQGAYDQALEQFNTILDYEDSSKKAEECQNNIDYNAAMEKFEGENYAEALTAFKALGSFKDSADKATECENNIKYNTAVDNFDNGKYEEATKAFKELGDFKDSADKYSESAMKLAQAKFDDKDYQGARDLLKDMTDKDEAKELLTKCATKLLNKYILDNGKKFDKLGKDFTDVTTMLDKDATYIKKDYKNDRDEDYSLLACATEGSDSMKIIYYCVTREKQSAGTTKVVSTADMPLESGSFPGVYGVVVGYLEKGSESQKLLGMVGQFYNAKDGDSDNFDIKTANKDSKWTYGGVFKTMTDDEAKDLTEATTDNMKYIFKNADDLLSDSDVTLKDLGFESV